MKKIIPFIFCLLLLCVSCAEHDPALGTITFDTSVSRGITASIDYPSLLDRTWTLTAVKNGGEDTGAGTYEDLLPTDAIGPFSVGSWTFTITDSQNLFTGSVTTTIKPGNNTISITLHSTSSKGTLLVENCNFLKSKVGANVNFVDCYIDENRMNGTEWVVTDAMTEDGDYYVLPTLSFQIAGGVHTIRLYYGADNGGFSSENVNIRVVNGMTTHFSIGEQAGNLAVSVSFDIQDAIVN